MTWPTAILTLVVMAFTIGYAVLGIQFILEGMMAKKKKGGKKC